MANNAPSDVHFITGREVPLRRFTTHRLTICILLLVCLRGYQPALGQVHAGLSSDPQKRTDQMSAVVAKLPDSQDNVLAALNDDDVAVRNETLKQLTNQEHLAQVLRTSVTRLVKSEDAETRLLAISCLAHSRISDQAEIDAITTALSDPVATVRLAAVQAVSSVETSAKCTTEAILKDVEDQDYSVQLAAVKVLREIKCNQSRAVPILARLSDKSPSAQVRTAALQALGETGADIDESTNLLLGLALKERDADVRRGAVRALQNLGSLTPKQVGSLGPLVHDASSQLRQSAAYTFVVLGRKEPHALEFIGTLQTDTDEGVREHVAIALRYGQAEKPVFLLVAKSLKDTSMEVRLDAAGSLSKLKGEEDNPADQDSGPGDLLLPHPDGIWPKELIVASIEALAQSESASLREYLANAIRRFGVSDDGLVKRLTILATTDPDEFSRRASVRAISNVRTTTSTLAALITASRDSRAVVRKQAVVGLGKLSSDGWPLSEPRKAAAALDEIETALAARLVDKVSEIRLVAFQALDSICCGSYLSNRSTLPKLETTKIRIQAALKDEDPDIREAAAKTLGSLQLSDNDIQALFRSLQDNNLQVGVQAAKSLASIEFFDDRVKQSVGLMPITFFDFTTPEAVIAETTRNLKKVAPKCNVIDGLIASIGSSLGSELRVQELQSLSQIATNANSMVKALQDGEPPSDIEFIKAATAAVNGCAPSIQKAQELLVKQLDSPDPQIRTVATTAVGDLQLESADVVSALDRLTKDDSREVRKAAVTAVPGTVAKDDVDGTSKAANKVVAATLDSDSEVRLAAIQSIVKLKSVDSLAQSFRSPVPEVRKAIIEGYTRLETPASDIMALLKDALRDQNRFVRLQTLSYLKTRGNTAFDLLRDVIPLFSDKSAEIRAAAASIVGYYKADAAFAVSDLERLLNDEDSDVKSAAADSLGWIGPSTGGSVPALVSLLSDEVVGAHARLALQRIGAPAIPELTRTAQSSADQKQAQQASEVLDAIKTDHSQHLFRLTLKDGNERTIDMQSSIVFAVATWCPFSRKLRDFLVRDDVRPYFKGINLYFLLEDETSTVEYHLQEQLKDRKEWTEQHKKEVLDEVKEKVAAVSFFDESFPGSLPGEQLQVMTMSTLAVNAFPSVLSPSSAAVAPQQLTKTSWLSVHDWAKSDWFSAHINMPDDMRSELTSISGGSILGF